MRPICPVSGRAHRFDRCIASVCDSQFSCDCREFGRSDGYCFHRALYQDGLFSLIRRDGPSPTLGVHLLEEYQSRCVCQRQSRELAYRWSHQHRHLRATPILPCLGPAKASVGSTPTTPDAPTSLTGNVSFYSSTASAERNTRTITRTKETTRNAISRRA